MLNQRNVHQTNMQKWKLSVVSNKFTFLCFMQRKNLHLGQKWHLFDLKIAKSSTCKRIHELKLELISDVANAHSNWSCTLHTIIVAQQLFRIKTSKRINITWWVTIWWHLQFFATIPCSNQSSLKVEKLYESAVSLVVMLHIKFQNGFARTRNIRIGSTGCWEYARYPCASLHVCLCVPC